MSPKKKTRPPKKLHEDLPGCEDCGAPEGEECVCAENQKAYDRYLDHITGDNDREYDAWKDGLLDK